MKTTWSRGVVVVLVTAAGLVAWTGCGVKSVPAGPVGPAAFLTQQNLGGRVALIEFGMLTCDMSNKGLDAMTRMNRDRTVPDLAYVCVEVEKDPSAFDSYVAAKSPGFAVHRDADASLAKAFDATFYPCFVLVDRFGHVRYRGKFPEEAKLREWVGVLAAETTDPGPDIPVFGVVDRDTPKLLAETALPNLSGETRSLRDYMGRNGLLAVFVDSNCPFSAIAIGDMMKVSAKLAEHDVPSLLVNIGDPEDAVRKYYAEKITGTPVLYDTTRRTQEMWSVNSVPTVFLFDSAGKTLYEGKAVWRDVAAAGERGLPVPKGSLRFEAQGTGFG